jgi:hypothetical protein
MSRMHALRSVPATFAGLYFLVFLRLIVTAAAMFPQPVEYESGSSVLWLSPDVQVKCENLQLSTEDFQKHWTGFQQVLQ